MGFPYSVTTEWLGVGTDGKTEWVFVGFSESPNLTNTDTQDGYSLVRTRIKWDDDVENVTLTQEWGGKFLQFRDGTNAISKIARSSTVLLELDWYGEGKTYFRFSLAGSEAAITRMRQSCGTP
jgi:hypothetical protein